MDFELFDVAVENQKKKKKSGVREGEMSWSKSASVHGEEKANEMFPQARQARKTKANARKTTQEKYTKAEQQFIKLMNELIRLNVINSFDEIEAVGHRIVQGADHYKSSVVATDEVVKDVLDLASLAPLHNKAAATGIKAAKAVR